MRAKRHRVDSSLPLTSRLGIAEGKDAEIARTDANDTLLLTIGSRRAALPAGGVAPLRVAVKLANPEYARRNVADNKGVLAFIVGSGGSAYMPSFHLTRTDFADVEAPMRTAVAESMVAAARSGGRRVPQLVTQPFQCSVRPATPRLRSYRSLRTTHSANRAVRHHTRE